MNITKLEHNEYCRTYLVRGRRRPGPPGLAELFTLETTEHQQAVIEYERIIREGGDVWASVEFLSISAFAGGIKSTKFENPSGGQTVKEFLDECG